ncbi:MAG: hypothetical protein ACKOTZ_06865 [Chloroflexota bacterium]
MDLLMVTADDGRGLVARVYEAAAAAGIVVSSLYVLANGVTGLVTVSAEDDGALRTALARAHLRFIPIRAVEVDVEDRPEALAALFRRLADAGVDLRLAVPAGVADGRRRFALAARDHEVLARALAD